MTKVYAKLGGHYKTAISTPRHALVADEPLSFGGTDRGMSPKDLLLSSLVACKVMTLRWYAIQQKWELYSVDAEAEMETDLKKEGTKTSIRCTLDIKGNLTDAQRAKLLEIADRCPVHRTLNGSFDIATVAAKE